MKKLHLAALLVSALVLAGCQATPKQLGATVTREFAPDGSLKKETTSSSEYAEYVKALSTGSKPRDVKVYLEAPPGQTLNVVKVDIVVPLDAGQGGGAALASVLRPPEKDKTAVDVGIHLLDRTVDVVKAVVLPKYGFDFLKHNSTALAAAGTAGYAFVQAPGSTTNVTLTGNNSALATGGNASSTGPVTTTTTTTQNTTTNTTTDTRTNTQTNGTGSSGNTNGTGP